MRRGVNDVIVTRAAAPWFVLRIALLAVISLGAVALCPLPGWQWVSMALGVIAVVFPASFAGWGAIGCMVICMLASGPDPWRTATAVLVVHLVQVLSSLMLVIPPGTRIVLAALRPSAVRFLGIQALSQSVGIVMLLAVGGMGGGTLPWAAVLGAAALGALSVLLLVATGDGSHRPRRLLSVSPHGADVRGPS